MAPCLSVISVRVKRRHVHLSPTGGGGGGRRGRMAVGGEVRGGGGGGRLLEFLTYNLTTDMTDLLDALMMGCHSWRTYRN